jgi:hypothetical protein
MVLESTQQSSWEVKSGLALSTGPTEYVLPEDGDRIQSPKRVLKHKQDDVLDKDKKMDNVQTCSICTNVPSS